VRLINKLDDFMCAYRSYIVLNKITVPILYLFSNMNRTLQSLEFKCFSEINLPSGYYQVPIKKVKKKTYIAFWIR
jgi:hypothetical protein